MAQITVDHHDLTDTTLSDEARRDRARSLVPTVVAVGLLLGVVVAGALVVRNLLNFGLWLLGQ